MTIFQHPLSRYCEAVIWLQRCVTLHSGSSLLQWSCTSRIRPKHSISESSAGSSTACVSYVSESTTVREPLGGHTTQQAHGVSPSRCQATDEMSTPRREKSPTMKLTEQRDRHTQTRKPSMNPMIMILYTLSLYHIIIVIE